jgi:cytochrome c oxidase subunit 1/cytochrome c oxidase subunit I+III
MSRRVYTYHAGLGLDVANMVYTIGVYVFAIGLVVTLWNVIRSRWAGGIAGPNPWGAPTLEWLTTSPPADYNFINIPVLESREPLWDGGVAFGPAFDNARLTPRTTALDAELESTVELPRDNLWAAIMPVPMLCLCAALLVRWDWAALACGVVTLLCAARWMWPLPATRMETEL